MRKGVRPHLLIKRFLPPFFVDRLLAGQTDYEPLRPDVWATAHPEAIRQYRVEERRDKADRKQARRAARRRNPTTTAPQ